MRSWRHWGGIETAEHAAEEVARIEKELAGISREADFPVEFAGVVSVHNVAQVAGTPALAARGNQRPWLGDTLQLALTNLPAATPIAMNIGFSVTICGGLPGMAVRRLWVHARFSSRCPLQNPGDLARSDSA